MTACTRELNKRLLTKKIKFPLLEYSATLLFENIPDKDQVKLCNQIEPLKSIGGNVLIGKILLLRLENDFTGAIKNAAHYISLADAWYVCDIIGERVFGNALLTDPKNAIKELTLLSKHKSNWVVRSIGAGIHYVIKKGLKKNEAQRTFKILLSLANTSDKEIKQGVDWAAKTTAKFHPDLIEELNEEIENKEKVGQWFRGKVKIGLQRNKHMEILLII